MMKRLMIAAVLATTCFSSVHAGELIYKPLNPGFGGNPLLEDYYLGTAQIQNKFVERSSGGGGGGGVPTINFPPISIDLGGSNPNSGGTGGGTTGTPATATQVPQIQ